MSPAWSFTCLDSDRCFAADTTWSLKHSGAAHVTATTAQIAGEYESYFRNRGDSTTPARWSIDVTNTGSVASGLTILCFVSSHHPDAPIQKLVGFERLPVVAPGASATATVFAATTALSLTDQDGTEAIHAGDYQLLIGDPSGSGPQLRAFLSLSGANVTLWSLKTVRENFVE